jgi:hypothetical protein
MHHLKNVCTVGNTLDAQGLGRILEMFESTSQSAFKFTQDAQDLSKWTSPEGIVYLAGQKGGYEGFRVSHVLAHTVPNYVPLNGVPKALHSVFNISRHQLFAVIDQAWAQRGNAGVISNLTNAARSKDIYRIPWLNAGTVAGEDFIWIVLNKNTNEIVTSYPVTLLMIP